MFWNEDQIRLLRQIIEVDGRPYSHAAKILQCSRNAAVGKGKRLGLVSHNEPNGKYRRLNKKPKPAKPATNGQAAPMQAAPVVAPPPPPKPRRRRIRLDPAFHEDDALFFSHIATLMKRSSRPITDIPGNRQCKWINGSVQRGYWCREPVKGITSWCHEHYHRVYDVGKAYATRKKRK